MKRTKPKTYSGKYLGGIPIAAKSIKGVMSDALGSGTIDGALAKLKKAKIDPCKVNITGKACFRNLPLCINLDSLSFNGGCACQQRRRGDA